MRPTSWVYWLQEADPDTLSIMGFDLVVMDYSRDGTEAGEYSREEIEGIGKPALAYLSIGEAEDYRFYWREEWGESPPGWLGEENPEWPGNYVVRYWEDGWRRIVFSYLRRIVSEGFSGVYLDKIDSYEYWADSLGEREAALRMARLVSEISDSCRAWRGGDCTVIPQNGEGILDHAPYVLGKVSGWAFEDVLYGEEAEVRLAHVRRLVGLGKVVLSVEYIYDGDRGKVEEYYKEARGMGMVPYAADTSRELDRPVIVPGIQPPP